MPPPIQLPSMPSPIFKFPVLKLIIFKFKFKKNTKIKIEYKFVKDVCLDILKTTVRVEGIFGLYRGYLTTVLR